MTVGFLIWPLAEIAPKLLMLNTCLVSSGQVEWDVNRCGRGPKITRVGTWRARPLYLMCPRGAPCEDPLHLSMSLRGSRKLLCCTNYTKTSQRELRSSYRWLPCKMVYSLGTLLGTLWSCGQCALVISLCGLFPETSVVEAWGKWHGSHICYLSTGGKTKVITGAHFIEGMELN